jgi:ribosome-associated heat shock protein Hsp15
VARERQRADLRQLRGLQCVPRRARMTQVESTRVDRWLWSIRLYKTRADATAGCRGGHVRLNGRIAKPAAQVRVGDRVQARVHQRDRVLEVTRVIDTRVAAPIAAECYIDHSPPPPIVEHPRFAERERGAGRPSKRDRRQLDRWRGRTN